MSKTTEDKVVDTSVIVLMAILSVLCLYPFYYIFIYSVNFGPDIARNGLIYWLPRQFTLQYYNIVFTEPLLLNSFVISVLKTIIGTVASVLFTAMISYPLSKSYLRFRKAYLKIGIISMYFSGGLIPFYMLLRGLHLLDNFAIYIIPSLFAFFNAILFITFFRELPDGLEESAKIDGAGDFKIFVRIVLPLSMPVLATIALFNGVNQWNDWFTAAYFVSNEYLYPLQVILYKVITQASANQMMASHIPNMERSPETLQAIEYAAMVVSVVPIVMIYPFMQRYFIKGMMIGSIKG